jgi:organic radical activating enzyme
MQVNNQPIEVRTTDPRQLEVHSIFYTIQGEGPFAGRTAVFIRLAGCNLQCPGCDTDYTSKRESMAPKDIVEAVLEVIPNGWDPNISSGPIVVITGGEPFRQNLIFLLDLLVKRWAFTVQIETNGVLPIPDAIPDEVVIVCSPKTNAINRHNMKRISALKYVLHHEYVHPSDGLPTRALFHGTGGIVARPDEGFMGQIYVQPMDVKDPAINELNLKAAVKSCLEHCYTLQLQIHKIIGVE